MTITLYVERSITAIVDQNLEYKVSKEVWEEALIEHDGDMESAFDALNDAGTLLLYCAEDVVSQTLDIHETTVETSE